MSERLQRQTTHTLLREMRWFVNLRWAAGATVLLVAIVNASLLRWFSPSPVMPVVGTCILVYNIVLWWLIGRLYRRPTVLVSLAWIQILLDLLCLTVLTMDTGNWQSPLLGFYVFHMVFASLLLRPSVSFGAAVAALGMFVAALVAIDALPQSQMGRLVLAGWAVTIVLTVYLANHIVSGIRAYQARLIDRNKRIREMARQLRQHQDSLVQQEKLAAMGQMAAGMSHEIANPLANIDSVLQLAQRDPARLNAEKLGMLQGQVRRIQETIRRMRDFSHPTDSQWAEMRINTAVEDALAMVRFDRRTRTVDMRFEPAPGSCMVRVQPHALQQIIVNILSNALDAATQVDAPQVRLSAGCTRERCSIHVIDNGPGIKPEHMDRVFEPFFTTKPVGKGTGLGLAISYGLARQQHASLEIAREPGGGTRVSIHMQKVRGTEHGCAGMPDDQAHEVTSRFSEAGESNSADSQS
jgi:signal transduction histidine kinase